MRRKLELPTRLPSGRSAIGRPWSEIHRSAGLARGRKAPVEQCLFQFLQEKALAADFGQRPVENLVAPGAQRKQANLQAGIEPRQHFGNVFALPQRQTTLARRDSDDLHA